MQHLWIILIQILKIIVSKYLYIMLVVTLQIPFLLNFHCPPTGDEITCIIQKSKSPNCQLDPLPTLLVYLLCLL